MSRCWRPSSRAGYFVLRKIINGVLQALGPVGDVLDWLISRGEALASALWRQAVLAIRYVKKSVTEILDWALTQADGVFDRILLAIEEVGTALADVIEWAKVTGEAALEALGEATVRVGNSISYILTYLEKDVLPAIRDVIHGALRAGLAVANFIELGSRQGARDNGRGRDRPPRGGCGDRPDPRGHDPAPAERSRERDEGVQGRGTGALGGRRRSAEPGRGHPRRGRQ